MTDWPTRAEPSGLAYSARVRLNGPLCAAERLVKQLNALVLHIPEKPMLD